MKLFMGGNFSNGIVRVIGLFGTIACCCLLDSPAFAGDAPLANFKANPATGQQFGVVWRIKGEVVAEDEISQKSRPLHEGSPIYVGEHIRAAATGEAVIKTDDAGVVAVRSGAEFIPERFAAEGKKTDNMTLRLISGSLRIITGWIGKLNRGEDNVVTSTATIGIRGTDHEPYVLSSDMAESTPYKPGTYDKVNRGQTALVAGSNQVEIDPGKVGFVRQPTFATKGLMTILMPVLLDKIPNFYVPGQFDSELDQYTQTAEAESAKQLDQKLKAVAATPACAPTAVAREWLRNFDRAVEKRDAPTVLALFAPDVAVRATVRTDNGGTTTLDLDRDELVQSTIAAVKGLKHYKQRRLTLDAWQTAAPSCNRISLRSEVIEQGVQSGKPYRFESTEQYLLEQRDGKWLAIKAETTQK